MRRIRPAGDVALVRQSAMRDRSIRSPNHLFNIRAQPWELVPFMIAPVLPGDTIKAATFNVRALSKPIKSRLMGWWLEQFFFYVRVGDFEVEDQDAIKGMLMGTEPYTSLDDGIDSSMYEPKGKFPWLSKSYERIVRSYFRDEDDTNWANWGDGNYYSAKISGPGGVFDSIALNDMLLDPVDPGDADQWEGKWEAYQQLRNARLTTATWAEYLAMQGVSTGPQLVEEDRSLRRPELCHYTRSWIMPVQAVEPSTGVPSALVQWAVSDRWRKGRFCAEPGAIVGISLIRPKALLRNQSGYAMAYMMDKPEAWMPTALLTDPHAQLRMFPSTATTPGANDTGPIRGVAEDYWLDPKDLLLRGDQFTNFDLASEVSGALDALNLVELPGVENDVLNTSYPSPSDKTRPFSGADKWIDIDGNVSLSIASRAGRSDTTGRRAQAGV